MTLFFPFQWTFEDKVTHVTQPFLHTSEGIIYIWGWNQANEGVCVRVEDFKIPMWIELPSTVKIVNSAVIIDKPIEWTEDILDKLIAHLNTKMRRKEWSKEKTAEVNTKPSSRCTIIWFFGSEQRDIAILRQSFGNRSADLLAATVGSPVQVVNRNFGTSHFDTSHFINDSREQRRSINHRSRSIAGTNEMYDFKTRRRIAASGREGIRNVNGRKIK